MSKIVDREGLKAFRKRLDEKYVIEGEYSPQTTVGLADNFTPYSEDSGAEQSNPFISNGTGTNNNQEIVTVGDYGLLRSKNGNSVVVNQLVRSQAYTNSSYWITNGGTTTMSGDVGVLTPTQQGGKLSSEVFSTISGRKYLGIATLQLSNGTSGVVFRFSSNTSYYVSVPANTTKQTVYFVGTPTTNNRLEITDGRASDWGTISIYSVYLIDLTQWFNGDIPQDILDNPSHFSWYYNGDLSYNTGTLVNANGVKLVSTGRQQWNEEWEQGSYDTNGNKTSSTTRVRNKNPIKVIPNSTYYVKVPYAIASYGFLVFYYDENNNFISYQDRYSTRFTTPSNCSYVCFGTSSTYGYTYNHDITISLYYTPEQGGEGYDKYYPYETPYEVDTGNEVLRSAGSVKDYKEPNGTIHRVVGSYTFTGSESWFLGSGYAFATINAISNKLGTTNVLNSVAEISNIVFSQTVASQIIIYLNTNTYDTSAKINTLTNGKTIYYELDTETTEQGTPFAENLPINDYGMLYWDSDIPQGNTIFFPINYKGFLDDMYSRVDGDSSKYVIDTDLTEYVKQVDLSSGITSVLTGLSLIIKKVIKTGNIITLSICAYNESGSDISANTTLFIMPPNTYNTDYSILTPCIISGNLTFARIIYNQSGAVNVNSTFGNGQTLFINVSYSL